MRKLMIILAFCTPIHLMAQPKNQTVDQELFNPAFQNLIGEGYSDLSITHKGIHFRDEFLPGKIRVSNGDSLGELLLRYNSFEDQLIWLSKRGGQVMLDKLNIVQFELYNADAVFQFKRLELQTGESGFFQVCYEGNIKLYVKRKSVPYTSYIRDGIKYYKYKPSPLYYLIVKGKVYSLSRNIKNLYQLFPDKEDAIRNSIRGKRLSFKHESDFIKAIIGLEKILTEE